MTEDEMVGWHHRLDGHEFEQASGVGDGIGKPGILQSMGPQRVGYNRATELNWYVWTYSYFCTKYYNSQFKLFHIILPLHMWIWHTYLKKSNFLLSWVMLGHAVSYIILYINFWLFPWEIFFKIELLHQEILIFESFL